MTEATALKRIEEPQSAQLEVNDPNALNSPLISYLQTPNGHELATKVVGLIENLQKATLDSAAEESRRQMEFQHCSWRVGMWLQCGVFFVAIVTAGILAWNQRLDGAVGTLIGTLVGYVFGKN